MIFALRWVMVIVAAVCIDQLVKLLVVSTMDLHEAIEILPFLALYHARNEGIAFSMLSGMEGVALAVLAAVVLCFVLWLWRSTPRHRWVTHLGFALIVGGAIGNLIDRVALGYVVDYVLFHTPVWSFAIFNLADTFITVGAGLVILDEFILERRRVREETPAR
ncbi:signal peptidase II [Aureimonas populi]|uniref:Lipoprotein signal peptidase n=1 Tax=Aureimonas populi TaxID=1701758 RepID=A0ABW5CNB2_9HYPH|nr:signal peptidase II [Aureimonas populi]